MAKNTIRDIRWAKTSLRCISEAINNKSYKNDKEVFSLALAYELFYDYLLYNSIVFEIDSTSHYIFFRRFIETYYIYKNVDKLQDINYRLFKLLFFSREIGHKEQEKYKKNLKN